MSKRPADFKDAYSSPTGDSDKENIDPNQSHDSGHDLKTIKDNSNHEEQVEIDDYGSPRLVKRRKLDGRKRQARVSAEDPSQQTTTTSVSVIQHKDRSLKKIDQDVDQDVDQPANSPNNPQDGYADLTYVEVEPPDEAEKDCNKDESSEEEDV